MLTDMFSHGLVFRSRVRDFISFYAGDDNWHNIDVKSGSLGYGWLHYAYIRNLKPERVLCIGSRQGFVPAVCALACKDNEKGVVDFVDASYNQNENDTHHWGGIGLWEKIDPDEYFGKFGLADYINLHVMKSSEFEKEFSTLMWQYIHVDGDHSYEGVKNDFKLFWPKLNKGGMMCFHDIFTKDLGGLDYGVSRFWDTIKNKYQVMEFLGNCGLGVIQK